ncbi:MAG TPA: GDP-mannose 4,6-dehydratase [Alloacidobacterium sp.]|nr:GDP-mannose 4,6-dehydratase [Alloacidobacterium sp.]
MKNVANRTILITGGAGFIGSNLAERLLAEPDTKVRIFDNLSRGGVSHNVKWLRSLPGSKRLEFVKGDVRDAKAVLQAVLGQDSLAMKIKDGSRIFYILYWRINLLLCMAMAIRCVMCFMCTI